MEDDLLANLISIGTELLSEKKADKSSELKEINLFDKEDTNEEIKKPREESKVSESILEKADSSDDELYEKIDYNESGRSVNNLIKLSETSSDPQDPSKSPFVSSTPNLWSSKGNDGKKNETGIIPKSIEKDEVTNLPFFGLRVTKPLVSSQLLAERLEGKDIVTMTKLKKYTENIDKGKDWIIAGVIVSKSVPKTSVKGNQFLIWTISDLRFDLKTASIFLFGSAYKNLWKTLAGTTVAILNPNVLESKANSREESSLSITNPQHVMVLGHSKDLGTCKSKKKDGSPCTAFVNINICEYCIYHVKQEYQKNSSRRSDLQSNFSGRGLTALRNKVLGKDEVFYAGKSYTAIPAKKNQKLARRDAQRLLQLSGQRSETFTLNDVKPTKKNAAAVLDVSYKQRAKDLELLKKLNGSESKAPEKPIETPIFPSLSKLETIDLNAPISKRQKALAKINAIKYVQKHGPLSKSDPMNVKEIRKQGVKRSLEKSEETTKEAKIAKTDFYSDRFKKIMAAASSHSNLLEQIEDEKQEKYFNKMVAKEQMEEKMSSTYKIDCKAVRCLQCKYTSFSASDKCKAEKHPLKIFDTSKRFFACADCGNRTTVLTFVPVGDCKKCGSGNWKKTTMMKEKIVTTHSLSIRGDEQTFLNSNVSNSNLDLLIADE